MTNISKYHPAITRRYNEHKLGCQGPLGGSLCFESRSFPKAVFSEMPRLAEQHHPCPERMVSRQQLPTSPPPPTKQLCHWGSEKESNISRSHSLAWGQDPVLVGFLILYTLRVSICLQHFVTKNVRHTTKCKEFYSSHLSITQIPPLTLLNHVSIHLSLHPSLCLIFNTFQRDLKTSVQFPLNLSACTSSTRIQNKFVIPLNLWGKIYIQ